MLPNLDSLPLMEPNDPMLPMYDVATDAPDNCAAGVPWIPFPTFTNELCGDSADKESLPPISPGADDTPVIPWRARCAKCRFNGVCFEPNEAFVGDCARPSCGG